MQQYNFKKNFVDFRKNLSLTEQDRQTLISAKKIIHSSIKIVFNEMQERYFDNDSKMILSNFLKNINKIEPKFMSQGSFVYKTINKPLYPPQQQMDLDYGVYCPLSYIENKANGNFDQASNIIRNIIHNCIKDLCKIKNWELKKHSKCLRVMIKEDSHIDLPIYSIPDKEMETISESAANRLDGLDGLDGFLSYNQFHEILLATDNGWVESDPRVIHQWVKDTKNKFGDIFIDYSRYLKAWRDYNYPQDNSKFSSIMIMAGVAQVLSECSYSKNENIALDLLNVVNSIKMYLNNGGIKDPDNSERLDSKLPNKGEIIQKLNTLANNLNEAVDTGAVDKIIECFGSRFPKDGANVTNITASTSAVASSTYGIPIRQSRNN